MEKWDEDQNNNTNSAAKNVWNHSQTKKEYIIIIGFENITKNSDIFIHHFDKTTNEKHNHDNKKIQKNQNNHSYNIFIPNVNEDNHNDINGHILSYSWKLKDKYNK